MHVHVYKYKLVQRKTCNKKPETESCAPASLMATKTKILSYLFIVFFVLIGLYNVNWGKFMCDLRNGVIVVLLSAAIGTGLHWYYHFEGLIRTKEKSFLNSLMRDVTGVTVIISLIATGFVLHNIEGSCERLYSYIVLFYQNLLLLSLLLLLLLGFFFFFFFIFFYFFFFLLWLLLMRNNETKGFDLISRRKK